MKDREQLMANLQAAFPLANQLQMGTLAYLIERGLGQSPSGAILGAPAAEKIASGVRL
jgi:hypothetical protein